MTKSKKSKKSKKINKKKGGGLYPKKVLFSEYNEKNFRRSFWDFIKLNYFPSDEIKDEKKLDKEYLSYIKKNLKLYNFLIKKNLLYPVDRIYEKTAQHFIIYQDENNKFYTFIKPISGNLSKNKLYMYKNDNLDELKKEVNQLCCKFFYKKDILIENNPNVTPISVGRIKLKYYENKINNIDDIKLQVNTGNYLEDNEGIITLIPVHKKQKENSSTYTKEIQKNIKFIEKNRNRMVDPKLRVFFKNYEDNLNFDMNYKALDDELVRKLIRREKE
jgi:hypothetical protein